MKCDACGAPVENGVCTYCGKEFHENHIEHEKQEKSEDKPQKVVVNIISEIAPSVEKVSETNGFWKKLGLFFLWITFLPIMLSIYYWKKSNRPNNQKAIILVAVWLCLFLIAGIDSCINGDSISDYSLAEHIYDNAEVKEVNNTSVSVIHANESEITDEVLNDWYKNYVSENDYNYCVIVYDDTNPVRGVYGTKSVVQKGVELISDNGGYHVGSDRGSTFYTIKEDKTLEPYYTEPTEEEALQTITKIDGYVSSSFKGDGYVIDVGGDKNKLDANITLVNPSMDEGTYQDATAYLARNIKEENLPIGYMNIAFQSDKYTIKALGSVDDVSAYSGPSDVDVKIMN